MRLISPSQKKFVVSPNSPIEFSTDVITQIENVNLVTQRGASYKARQVKNPVVMISLTPFDMAGNRDDDILRKLLCQSSIKTYDSYTVSDGNTSVQVDPFNVDAYLFANKGRLVYRLQSYATAQVVLRIVSRLPIRFNLVIRTEIFDAE